MSFCANGLIASCSSEKQKGFFGFEKKRPSGNDLMKYPIEQSDIDKVIAEIELRHMLDSTPQPKPTGRKRKPYRKYVAKRDNIDKMMDYAIWKDKD